MGRMNEIVTICEEGTYSELLDYLINLGDNEEDAREIATLFWKQWWELCTKEIGEEE